jgi:hypothetical protein
MSAYRRGLAHFSTALLATIALTAPLHAGSSVTTGGNGGALFMPQGGAATPDNGDFFMSDGTTGGTTGINTPYFYFAEAPAGLSRLVLELFDADIGTAAGDASGNRDRSRTGGSATTAKYTVTDPNGLVQAERFAFGDTTNPATSDNAWLALFDSNDPHIIGQSTNTANGTGISLTVPAGAVGNLLVAVVAKNNSGGAWSPSGTPAGWTRQQDVTCPTAGAASCHLGIYTHVAAGGDLASYTFTHTDAARNLSGVMFRVAGVDTGTIPDVAANGTGTGNTQTAPTATTTVASAWVLRAYAQGTNNAYTSSLSTSEHSDLGLTNVSLMTASAIQLTAGASGTAAATTAGGGNWAAVTIAFRDSGTNVAPITGHWQITVDQRTSVVAGQSNDLNGLGIRANDGTAGAGGTEVPVYYDTNSQYGNNPTATGGDSRDYVMYPYMVSYCSGLENDFDFDVGNGTGNGGGGSYGSVELLARNPATTSLTPGTSFQTIASAAISADNTWNRDTINTWTSNSDASRYGIWRANIQISTYTTGAGENGNYSNVFFGNSALAVNPPTANPDVSGNAFRVYLPDDAGNAPVKPFLEQFVRWVSGPVTPTVGQTTVLAVTVRLVNPTTSPITFSNAASNTVVANVPGGTVTYVGSSAGATQGTIISQPANGGSGNIVWDPGTVAAGDGDSTMDNAEGFLLNYRVNVTPAGAGSINITPVPGTANATFARYIDETGNTTQTRARWTLGPICNLVVSTASPTRALITGFDAFRERGATAVEWSTSTEDGTVGYYLERLEPNTGTWRRVSDVPVLAVPGAVQGSRYRMLDPSAPRGVEVAYRLTEIERSGRQRPAGEFRVTPQQRDDVSTIAVDERGMGREPIAPPKSEALRLAAAAREAETLAAADLQRAPRAVSALKVKIRDRGLYYLRAADLATAFGVSQATIRADIQATNLRLVNNGQQVGWLPSGDGSGVYFFGLATSSIYSQDNVYWIHRVAGKRMTVASVAGAAAASATQFADRQDDESDLFPSTTLPIGPEGDYWFWDYFAAGDPNEGSHAYGFEATDAVAAGDGELSVRLQGASDSGVADEHQAEVFLNGISLGTTQWTGLDAHVASLPFTMSLLVPGANTIEIQAQLGGGAPYSEFFLDGYEVDYQRQHRALDERLEFRADANPAVHVTGFRGGDITLFDLTNSRRPAVVLGASRGQGADGRQIDFVPASPTTPYLAQTLTSARRLTAADLVAEVPSNLKSTAGAEYVVITDGSLAGAAANLAADRAAHGLTTLVAKVEDIYDEFNFGQPSVPAIRDFVAWATTRWTTPARFVTLVGGGTFDYRDNLGIGGNVVPAAMVSTAWGLFAADSFYADADGDGIPDVAIGRIPVAGAGELDAYRAKLAAYEAGGAWSGNALLTADWQDAGLDFASDSEQIADGLAGWQIERDYLGAQSVADARTQLFAALANGSSFWSFIGHGGLSQIGSAFNPALFETADVAALANADRPAVLSAMTCALNRFELPGLPSLGATLVRAGNGGAVAVWSASGLSNPGEALQLARRFTGLAFGGPVGTLGERLLAAERDVANQGGSIEEIGLLNLLGDPSLLLSRPSPPPPGPGTSGE